MLAAPYGRDGGCQDRVADAHCDVAVGLSRAAVDSALTNTAKRSGDFGYSCWSLTPLGLWSVD